MKTNNITIKIYEKGKEVFLNIETEYINVKVVSCSISDLLPSLINKLSMEIAQKDNSIYNSCMSKAIDKLQRLKYSFNKEIV